MTVMLPETETYKKALELTTLHHESQNKTFSGQFTWKQRKRIKEIIDRFDITSILDYGCGKGKQYNTNLNLDENGQSLEEFWGIETTKYDPGVRAYSIEPVGFFDLVLCVQVLGSIPLPDLPMVIDRLYGFANKVVFVAERIGTTPHKRIYNEIESIMPRGMTIEKWIDLLKRPLISDVTMIGVFRVEGRWEMVEV